MRQLSDARPDPRARTGATVDSESAADASEEPEEVTTADDTLSPNDTVVVIVELEGRMREDLEEIEALGDRVNDGNPYRLDRSGKLLLPGVPEIALAGLTEPQAIIRLLAEPSLAPFSIEFHLLPVRDVPGPDLEPFGYSVFAAGPERFGVSSSTPIPGNYAIGPGDEVLIQLFGNDNDQYSVVVGRDGSLNLPELGPIQAAGLSFDALRDEIRLRVSKQLIGSEVSVTLGELRSVRVFLTGDVRNPGAHQVSAFSTITNLLALGGGVAESGSLRDIQLKRDGKVVTHLDLYSLLLEGDASNDRRVSDGDVVFVPPVGPIVTVTGQVRRPAIYEYRKSLTVAQAVEIAGGALPDGLLSRVRIERSSPERGLTVFEVDLRRQEQAGFGIEAGDRVVIAGDTDQLDNAVTVSGHVHRPGVKQWRRGLRLSDVLTSASDIMPNADDRYVLIRRQPAANEPIEVLSADLAAVWRQQPGAQDPELVARDEIIVFSLDDGRDVYLEPILESLRQQALADAPSAIVSIDGQVRAPGSYPLESGMTIADLIRAAGGLAESAYKESAELRRYAQDSRGQRESRLESISLVGLDELGNAGGPLLQPFDHLNVKQVPNWDDERFLEIRGDVTFPGRYSVGRDERLSSVIQRAGGLSDSAFAAGAIFTRESLREREREQLEALAERIESDLATLALSNPDQVDAISIGQSLLRQVRNTEPTGRLVIDMQAIVDGSEQFDIFVRDGDALYVPQRSQEVTIVGEVQYATSHLWQPGVMRDEYIARSGGITAKADRKRIYVVRASGEVVIAKGSRFYANKNGTEIRPGDTIVVPLKTDRVAPLVLWSSVTQIVYNLAIAAAAVSSF